MDDWPLDENHLVSDNNHNIVNLWCQIKCVYKGWQITLGLHFDIGDTTWAVHNQYWARQ